MGLIDLLTRAAAARAHVLVAEAPGALAARVALERELDRRGWCLAESVADADVLVVVGEPGEDLAAVIDHVWAQLSEPRVRIQVRNAAEASERLDEAHAQLGGLARRLTGPDLRAGFTPATASSNDDDDDDDDEMMPDGIALAEGAEDRDGLEMDELHLPMGPVLAHWPAGLVLRVTLHGDIVSAAEVERLPAEPSPVPETDGAATRAARLLDAAASVLTLAGAPAEAGRARRLRDGCLDRDVDGREVARLGERVGRLRVLRWSLAGLTVTGSHGGSEQLHDRLVGLFERAAAELHGEPGGRVGVGLLALPELVRGLELSALRLWVAALGPDLVAREPSEESRG